MPIHRCFVLGTLLAAVVFTPMRRIEAQSPIATSLAIAANPSTVYPGQATTVTVTITVVSGSVSALNGEVVDVMQSPEASNGFSLGYFNNGVATVSFYPIVNGTGGGTVTLAASFNGGLLGNPGYSGSSASTNLTVLPISSTTLQVGQYIFLLQGVQGMRAMAWVGSLALDGNGNVTGEEDLNSSQGVLSDVSVTGSYAFNQNGVGPLTLLSTALRKQQFAVFLPSPLSPTTPSGGSLIETDGNAVGKGKLMVQGYLGNAGNATYAIDAQGESTNYNYGHDVGPVLVSGQLTLGSSTYPTQIQGAASETIGTTVVPNTPLTGLFGAPDSQGRFVFTAAGAAGYQDQPTHFVGYEIDYEDMVLMSTDSHATNILISGTGRGGR